MKTMMALGKKEWMEQIRSGRLTMLGILFILLGVMNPAIAKLTPDLLAAMADSLAESGMVVTEVTVDALTSWGQFFKNIPMGLIAFVLLESAVFTREIQSGTLILLLTRGVSRWQVLMAKAAMLMILWSAGYWLCFGITYGYNAYFWDNAAAENLLMAVFCWWLAGIWMVWLTICVSAAAKSNIAVLIGTGGIVLAAWLAGMFPRLKPFSPAALMDGAAMLMGTPENIYGTAACSALILMGISTAAGLFVLNRRQL